MSRGFNACVNDLITDEIYKHLCIVMQINHTFDMGISHTQVAEAVTGMNLFDSICSVDLR